ncbi:polyphosphate kinase 2 family protein [Luteolibacter marinus]|uniref:polyphosphate kinase 2 family protein n=1 Tax=Luteolibacter marinus TaxID=2776705 RepID=UPI0018671187|nr:polyphosphate kinase 2 family protein [Luteolibacter marinus]
MSKDKHRFPRDAFRVEPGKKVKLKDFDPADTQGIKDKQHGKEALLDDISELAEAQSLLWANSTRSLLIILQARDAAGKDGAIKHVMSGINPQGVDVYSFKAPDDEELKHHFLWRPMQKLPARGRIAIFNRSYYEEVLVVRVHPSFLDRQVIPSRLAGKPLEKLWEARYDEINRFEQHLVDSDISVIKIFLNVSKEEQRERLLDRLNEPGKLWKFSAGDLAERELWDEYDRAYEDMLNATSTEAAPWHVIPADKKWFARAAIADLIVSKVRGLKLEPPQPTEEQLAGVEKYRQALGG